MGMQFGGGGNGSGSGSGNGSGDGPNRGTVREVWTAPDGSLYGSSTTTKAAADEKWGGLPSEGKVSDTHSFASHNLYPLKNEQEAQKFLNIDGGEFSGSVVAKTTGVFENRSGEVVAVSHKPLKQSNSFFTSVFNTFLGRRY